MQISYCWLRDYIRTNLSIDEIAAIFTSIGLEVESVTEFCPVKGGMDKFVIGEVLTCEKHPNADKLSVTTVNIGTNEILQIVCGAPNVAAGQKVVVATVGATVYLNKDNFVIKKAKIRGTESAGMICAEDEIGLGRSHDGILVLDEKAIPGTPALEFFGIEKDYIFEIGLTPNRIDAASHIGAARDLAAYLSVNTSGFDKNADYQIPSVDEFHVDNNDRKVSITIENTEACPRYAGLTISGVTIAPSPSWLQNRLRSIGLTPINNVVDITNYVLHETAQPLHAFDANKISGNKIIVKTLPERTTFVTLDGVERNLTEEDLMICNEDKGMCIGGVLGGLDSGITGETTDIFLESAYFNPQYIRRTSKRHGIFTDASFRFERGIDPNNTVYALKRAAMLIKEITGGKISSEIIDIYPEPIKPFRIELAFRRINKLIGQEIAPETIQKILEALEIRTESKTAYAMIVKVPPYRVDVRHEADIIEEVLRIYGYNNIDFSDELHSTLSYTSKPDKEKIKNIISDYLSNNGFFEMMSNSLTKSSYYKDSKLFNEQQSVKILNPLSQDLGCMRQTLLFGCLEAIIRNINHKSNDLKLYEFGNCYYTEKENKEQILAGYTERHHLALAVTGNKTEGNWNTPVSESSFFTLKGYTENIIRRLGIDISSLTITETSDEFLEEGLTYRIGKIGLVDIGLVRTDILKRFDIKKPVYYADFQWDELVKLLRGTSIAYMELSRFPEVYRDLSLLVNEEVRFADICRLALKTEQKLLKDIKLFDVYESDKIENGKKSYAVRFILQDKGQTLTDKQIDKSLQRIVSVLEKETGAQIRH